MPTRTIEDQLREEYFDLLPEIRRVAWQLETEIRYCTLDVQQSLNSYEQLTIKSRIKDCESAVKSLQRRQEGRVFDPDRPGDYSILQLPDLAGVRALVFPNSRLLQVDNCIHALYPDWTPDPVSDDKGAALAVKYYGYRSTISKKVRGEYQVVPMLLGLFWEVEHTAMYKPAAHMKDIVNSEEMRVVRGNAELALRAFEAGFDDFVRKSVVGPHHTIQKQDPREDV
jgi:ppGpp synthetase/RelA/SpoT-type nucleotidyltranferase